MKDENSTTEKAHDLARHEVNWWKAHHRRQQEQLLDEMTRLYVLQFDLDYEDAKRTVQHRVMAASLHDMAERLEDKGNREASEAYWNKAEEELREHYLVLLQLTRRNGS